MNFDDEDEDDEGGGGEDGDEGKGGVVHVFDDPVEDGFGWVLRAVEVALVGGTKGPPAGAAAACAFDLIATVATASARADLAAGRGLPHSGGWSGSGRGGGVSRSNSPSEATARLSWRELERILPILFPDYDDAAEQLGVGDSDGEGVGGANAHDNADDDDDEKGGGNSAAGWGFESRASVLVEPVHAAKLQLWLGLHRSARMRQLAAARQLFHLYGGAHAEAANAASRQAGEGSLASCGSHVKRVGLLKLAGCGQRLKRLFTSLVTQRLNDCDIGVRQAAVGCAALLFYHYKPESHDGPRGVSEGSIVHFGRRPFQLSHRNLPSIFF
jgi:hypothetical protein